MTLDTRQLRYFVAVAEERHFGRAADGLRIAQPGLSRQIKRLEESIGVPLFSRTNRQIELTSAGEAFLPYARLVIGMADRAVAEARAASEHAGGLLKIGGYAITYYPRAGDLLQQYTERYPDIDVEFVPGHAAQSFERLLRGSIDMGFVTLPFQPFSADARYRALGQLEAIVAVPSHHRLAAKERIARTDLFADPVFTWPRELNPILADRIRATVFGSVEHPQLIEIADVFEVLLRVSRGEGLAIVNAAVTGFHSREVEFRSLEDPAMFEYGLIWLETSLPVNAQRLLDLAAEADKTRAIS